MFLVHDDQAERVHRREDRRTRADDNTRASLTNLVPFIVAFARGQMAVQHRDERLQRPGTEARLEPLDGLGRQRNFRHEDDGASALLQRAGNRLQINFRLPAARDAVEQEDGRWAGGQAGR